MTRDSDWLVKPSMVAAILMTIVAATCQNIADLDMWHEMALARELFTTGRLPRVDIFAYTPTLAPFVHHEWGAGVIAYLIAMHIGPAGILALKYLLLSVTAGICYACARRRGGPLVQWAPLALPPALLSGVGYLPIRAQVYTFLAVAALCWSLIRDDEGSRKWILPWLAAFPIWANLHGGCAVAFVLIGAHWFERVISRKRHLHLLAVEGSMAALLLVNPYGIDYPVYLWRALLLPRPNITEWLPIWRIQPVPFAAFILAVGVVAYCLAVAAWRHTRLPFGSAIVITTAIFAGMHIKLVPLFAIAFISFVPGWLPATPLPRLKAKLHRDWGDVLPIPWLICTLVMFGMIMVNSRLWGLKVLGEPTYSAPAYPVAAVDYLKNQRFSGNLMTTFNSGAYCMWKLYPAVKVSLDSRYELVFTEQQFEESIRFYNARPDWRTILRKYPTDVILMPTSAKVAPLMPTIAWKRVYSDSEYELYARPGLHLPQVTRAGKPPDGTLP